MEITSVNPDNNYSQHTVSESNWGQMGKSEFLKLITAQLKYQDPLAPADNSEFLSQAAQFNILEQIMNLNNRFDSVYAQGLAGKEIYWENDNFEVFMGTVEGIEIFGGTPWLAVGGELVSISQVISISAPPDLAEEEQAG
ncbi:MAG: flagellar hook capping FlgD N-terminal domain-containing protein [Actinomycetota bacterium]|nr:flagellar hook capping FlgD N-terminal domain-containing protein [Actinomycetota bacterium]